jgi:ribose transport system ATP-binding protein
LAAQPILRMEGISKEFPGVKALNNVSFSAYPGEVMALVGENGAGKSTLMKILCGAYPKDAGQVAINGKEVQIENPHQAQELGIAIIYQEFNLTPNQTAAANIYIAREPKARGLTGLLGFVDKRRMETEAQRWLEQVGARIPATALVRDLSVAQQQMVEIAKSLAVDARIIVMDEPTSALGEEEVETLFDIIDNLKQQGIAVVFISHRLEEIMRIADRVTVLRDGHLVGSLPISKVTPEVMIDMMVGRELTDMFAKVSVEITEPILEVSNLSRGSAVRDVSFQLRRGEILGFAGLVGAGRTETARLIFGADPRDSGEILVEGQHVNMRNSHDALKAGIALVPEDRGQQGLVLILSVLHNIMLPSLDNLTRTGWVNRRAGIEISQRYAEQLSIRTPYLSQKAMYLSGGNQQKVVLAKWLAAHPKVLIMDEPTRGIDVGAKAEVHSIMGELTRQGLGIIMISSEMPEILGMSDRVVVMHEGRVAAILDREEATQELIMAYASGEPVVATDANPRGEVQR